MRVSRLFVTVLTGTDNQLPEAWGRFKCEKVACIKFVSPNGQYSK